MTFLAALALTFVGGAGVAVGFWGLGAFLAWLRPDDDEHRQWP